jgi:hypothetical protein
MISIVQRRTVSTKLELTDTEARAITVEYLQGLLGGDGCYIAENGLLAHWTSWPHGSGTTTYKGEPTRLQRAAWELLPLITDDRSDECC